jgi:2-dehydro-3-deoxy-D-arabinonate dehydratase
MLTFRYRTATGIVEATAESPEELEGFELAIPVEPPEVWGAGVTYERSRDARVAESDAKDLYLNVYEAERPELFLKDAGCRRTVGPGEALGVRSDSAWNVPEPEIAVVLGDGGTPAGLTIGNDVSSRDIEGTNPLYLPQAKIFAGACALGPAVLVPDDWEAALELLRANPVPPGSVLLTGTGLVPPDDFNLEPGHVVEIHVPGIGTLTNPVVAAEDLLTTRRSEINV